MASSGSLRPFQSRLPAGAFGPVRVVTVPAPSTAPSTPTTADKFRLRPEDYEKIVEWLEVPENFQQVVGGGRRTRVGGKCQSKAVVFKQMQVVLQSNGFPKQISAANLGKRFDRYVQKYKQAREVKLSTGGGLSEEEVAAGMVLEDKLNRICPHFSRMEALYGGRPNVSPTVLGEHGLDLDEEYLHPRGDAIEDDLDEIEPGDENDFLPSGGTEFMTPENSFANENLSPMGGTHHEHGRRSRLNERVLSDDTNFWENIQDIARKTLRNGDQSNKTIEISGDTPMPGADASGVDGHCPPKALSSAAKKSAKKIDGMVNEKHATSKPNMAAIYSERLNLKAEYRKELIETRDRWKTAELEERREARLQARVEASTAAKANRRHQLAMEAKKAAYAEKKAKLDADLHTEKASLDVEHRMLMAKQDRRTALLLEMVRCNKSHEELLELVNLAGVD